MKMAMTRRDLLKGAATGAALTLPFFSGVGARKAKAATTAFPRRAIFLYMPQNETEDFTPKMVNGALSFTGTYLEPMNAYAAKACHISNLTGTSGHQGGHSEWLTGWPSTTDSFAPTKGPSLDQYIAGRLGTTTHVSSLGLTLGSSSTLGNVDEVVSWTDKALAVPSLGSAHLAFAQVFGTATPPSATMQGPNLPKSLLDALLADYARVNATLGTADRTLLDAHLTLLRQVEARLQNTGTGLACTWPTNPAESGTIYYPNLRQLVKDETDVLVGALRCDMTRVVTLAFGPSGTEGPYDWSPINVPYFHEVSHRNASYTKDPKGDHFKVRTWYSQQVAYLLQQLDSTPEGDGTLLDHTLVAWLPELGYYPTTVGGSSPNPHIRDQISVLLFGGSGFFKTNTMVDVGKAHYHNLLLTMGQAMGYSDLTTFGAKGTTPIRSIMA
jgi:Protein of unknown function (DUF1552)